MRRILRDLGDLIGAGILAALIALCRALPRDLASAVSGRWARLVGPVLPAQKTARRNLKLCYPGIADSEIASISRACWDNLGRIFAELADLPGLVKAGRVTLARREHLEAVFSDSEPALIFSGHFANWEMIPNALAANGFAMHSVYRPAANRFAERIIERLRHVEGVDLLPKGREGAKAMLRLLERGEHVGILLDQKLNDGIPVPFFGHPAMTAPAIAQLARRFDCPILPLRCVRTGGVHFRIEFEAPFRVARTDDRNADIETTMLKINGILERWVRENPGQWFWVHRRWPASVEASVRD